MTFYLELVGGLFVAWFILVVLFAPHIPYHVEQSLDASSDRVPTSPGRATSAGSLPGTELTRSERTPPPGGASPAAR